jgi:hypothetical protein
MPTRALYWLAMHKAISAVNRQLVTMRLVAEALTKGNLLPIVVVIAIHE